MTNRKVTCFNCKLPSSSEIQKHSEKTMNLEDKIFAIAKVLYPEHVGFDVRRKIAFIRYGNLSNKIVFATEIGYVERDGEIVYREYDPSENVYDMEELLSYVLPTREIQIDYHNFNLLKLYRKQKGYKGRVLLSTVKYHPTDNMFGEVLVHAVYEALVKLGEIKQEEV